MPLGESPALLQPTGVGQGQATPYLAYVTDGATEAALQQGMAEMAVNFEIHRGGIKAALATLQDMGTPRVLIVDVSGDEAPLASLEALSDMVEPQVCVLATGDLSGLDFYREVTRGVGVAEYLAKPLTREMVARHFAPLAQGRVRSSEPTAGGRILTVTGVRGGVGATTVAVNLAWQFGVIARRHTVLLDPDTHFGTASFLLNVDPGGGLSAALQAPDRIDTLLAERAAQPVNERLHLLGAQEKLDVLSEYAPDAAEKLLAALRRRYNFIVADVPYRPIPLYRDLLVMAHRRVLVLEPTLACVRDALRLMQLPFPAGESNQSILVLNRLGQPGGLARRQIEDALQIKVDLVIPDLPKLLETAATFGEPAVGKGGAFHQAIVELGRQAAFTRLLDTAGFWSNNAKTPKKGIFGRLRKAKS